VHRVSVRFDLLVRGDVVSAGRVIRDGALAVRGGKIAAVLGAAVEVEAERVVDVSGRFVLPGLVDTHVHTLSAPTEGIGRATAAAAAGGVTTIVDMPYDRPEPVMDRGRFEEKVEAVGREALVDVALYGTMARVDGIEALPGLLEAGVVAFKFSTFETDPVRFPRIAEGDLLAAFRFLAGENVPIVVHAEAQEIVESLLGRALAAGEDDPDAHDRSRPVVAETLAIAKLAELAYWTGARLHVAHVTHPHGFRILARYRELGARVSGETCAHYLSLSADDVRELGAIAKVNPPIRDREAREGLWEAVRDGLVETVSTDHAPWPLEAKRRPMLQAASGMPGLETFLPVVVTEGLRRDVALPELVELAAGRPADLFGLGGRKGRLEVGHDADFAVFDARRPWTFDASRSRSSATWSPFSGREFAGRVEATYLRGRPVFENGEVVATAGSGIWLRR
jgi:allantoinase